MLTVAIATFFALALTGSILTIAMMFHTYQDKIKAVIVAELGENAKQNPVTSTRYRAHVSKPYAAKRRRSFQPAPLRAAA